MLLDWEVEERDFSEWSMGFRIVELPDLQQAKGLRNIRCANDLKSVEANSQAILGLMQNFYMINAGKGA